MSVQPFHLAVPVKNLELCRSFYRDTLGLTEGRSSDHWVDFDFFGHQFVLHQSDTAGSHPVPKNEVDGKAVPVLHYGVVLNWDHWHAFAERLRTKGIEFIVEPYIRFEGMVGEQATLFFLDPEGNALEFKAFKDESQLFAK